MYNNNNFAANKFYTRNLFTAFAVVNNIIWLLNYNHVCYIYTTSVRRSTARATNAEINQQ